jgi:hypothetical protein
MKKAPLAGGFWDSAHIQLERIDGIEKPPSKELPTSKLAGYRHSPADGSISEGGQPAVIFRGRTSPPRIKSLTSRAVFCSVNVQLKRQLLVSHE